MKASERRLLLIFLLLLAVAGGWLLSSRLETWQSGLGHREWQVEQEQVQAATLLAEAPEWEARGAWVAQVQPVAASEQEANQGLLDTLQQSATEVGLEINKKEIETVEKKDYYRQFGVTLTVKGTAPAVMRWVHGLQAPTSFYVIPLLHVTPDKDEPTKVNAKVTFWRWYGADLAAAKAAPPPGAEAAPAPSSGN